MDMDEDDDFYAPEEPEVQATTEPSAAATTETKTEPQADDLEEGEEEDEGGEMDEDDDSVTYPSSSPVCRLATLLTLRSGRRDCYRTKRRDKSCPSIVSETLPPSNSPTSCSLTLATRQSRYSDIRNIPQRSASNDATVKAAPIKKEGTPKPSISGADLPAVSTSKVDINAIPIHKGTGKPITQVDIDKGQIRTRTWIPLADTLTNQLLMNRPEGPRQAMAQARH
jgi:pre-mRNA 3'-end-processing factor FIP1